VSSVADLLGPTLTRTAVWVGTLFVATVLGLAATHDPALALSVVCGAFFIVVTFRDLGAGLILFVPLIFFEHIPGSPVSSLSFVKFAGAVLAAAWLVQVMNRRRPVRLLYRDHPVIAAAALAFLCWAVLSMAWAPDRGESLEEVFRLLQGVLLLFIAYSAFGTPRHLRWLLWAYVVGATMTALIGLLGATGPDEPGRVTSADRLAGGIGDPNELAALLLPALVFCAFGLLIVERPLSRWALACLLVLFTLALVLAQSRGAFVALGAVFLAAAMFAGPARARALVLILCVSAVAVVYYVLVAPPESFERITDFSAAGSAGRSDFWAIALSVVNDHPVQGVGLGNFTVVEPVYAAGNVSIERVDLVFDATKVVHNTYLQLLSELGAIGLLAFTVVALGALTLGLRGVRVLASHDERQAELTGRAIVIALVGTLAALVFISGQFEKQLWLLLGAAMAVTVVSRQVTGLVDAGDERSRGLNPSAQADAARRPAA
jgi:O-antigen ligase